METPGGRQAIPGSRDSRRELNKFVVDPTHNCGQFRRAKFLLMTNNVGLLSPKADV